MKKADNPLAALQAQRDAAIRADERQHTTGKLRAIRAKLDDVVDFLSELTGDSPYRSPKTPGIAPAPKRKAVTATTEHIGAALEVLCNTHPRFSLLTAKQVATNWHAETGAYRLAGAALKALVADGRATVKRGKYAQAQPEEGVRDGTDHADSQAR
jgi:hypothetical protein